MRALIATLGQVDCDVLILGEIGTGKTLAARALHAASRAAGPFVAVHCAGTPDDLLDAELFGREEGGRATPGSIETARGGTLFIDDIGSMPYRLQGRLLKAIDERGFVRSPGATPIRIDCRIVAAARPDLAEASAQGRFRSDLFFRLDVATLRMPALRDHPEDIPELFSRFVAARANKHGVVPPPWTAEDIAGWQQRPWPGNVRELRSLADRWALGLERFAGSEEAGVRSLAEMLARVERAVIEGALRQHAGSVPKSAEQLGIPRKTLYDKLGRLGIDPTPFRADKP